MNVIVAILEVVLVVSIVLTAVQEPKLSMEYGIEVIKSTYKAFDWSLDKLSELSENGKRNEDQGNSQEPVRSTGG